MTKECPEVDPRALLGTLYGEDLYCSFTKVNAAIGHATSTVTLDGEEIECQVACQRQENDISISTQGFPGESFSRAQDFWLVVYKLIWSCIAGMSLQHTVSRGQAWIGNTQDCVVSMMNTSMDKMI